MVAVVVTAHCGWLRVSVPLRPCLCHAWRFGHRKLITCCMKPGLLGLVVMASSLQVRRCLGSA